MFSAIRQIWHHLVAALYQMGMRHEYKKAGLQKRTTQLSCGHVTYLDSAQHRQGGQQEAVLMLHGAGAEKDGWVRFAAHLGKAHRLLIPDLPGHGESESNPEIDFDIHSQANRVVEFLDNLQVRKVHLIGHSMGGAIAMRIAHLYPDVLTSLVLIDSAGAEGTPGWLRTVINKTGKNPLMEIETLNDFKRMLEIAMSSPPYMPAMFLKLLARRKIARRAIDKKIFLDIQRDLNQTATLDQIRIPSFILWGEEDKVLHVDDAQYLH
ncbi:MAG: alpha/beta fold hydrolase, partial [Burkholderiales bacterium]|nr:alpha/beta fold hydrolase [Burkholderiales bacterium]